MTARHHSVAVVGVLVAMVFAVGTSARAQCPTTLPQSVINSIRLPEARAAAQSTRLDAAMIAQNGGLPNMIRLAHAQLAADRATVAEERRNQTYLAQNGMANDKRAVDGRAVIQMLEDSQRATSAFIEIMECHNKMSGAPGGQRESPVLSANAWEMSPTERQSALSYGGRRAQPPQEGANVMTALDSLSRSMRDKAMANASPEVAAFWAKQDALRANGDANTAAAMAGQSRGRADARNDSLNTQMKMVNDAVKGWQVPRGYSAATATNAGVIADPFATSAPLDFKKAVELALGSTGLAWNRTRQLAQVAAAQPTTCGGRLRVGDYPVLPDGNLLDTPERIAQFLEACAVSDSLLVVRESGEVEVRK